MNPINIMSMPKSGIIGRILTLIVLLIVTSGVAYSQFGQNKVQYKKFNWQFIQTKHFDIYFHQGGDYLAQFAAHEAEEALSKLTENIDYEI